MGEWEGVSDYCHAVPLGTILPPQPPPPPPPPPPPMLEKRYFVSLWPSWPWMAKHRTIKTSKTYRQESGIFVSGSTLVYIGMTQSSHRLNSRIQPALLFLTSANCDEKFHLLKILFLSLLSQNFKSLPRKTTEIRPFTILAFSSGFIIIIIIFFFIIRLNFYKAYLRNGAT